MSDTYATPQSDLVETSADSEGSLERGLAGDYEISISNILSEAWQKTKGVKRYILGAGIIMYVVMFAAVMVLGGIFGGGESSGLASLVFQLVIQVLIMALALPFFAGIFIISARKIQGKSFEFGDAFGGFGKTLPLITAGVLMNIMITIGMILLILPGIYLSFAYMLAIPLIVDRNLAPWEALETSRKAITKHWFSFFIFWIVMMLILIVSTIPFGLGLIWAMPMLSLAFAIIYREVFGISTL